MGVCVWWWGGGLGGEIIENICEGGWASGGRADILVIFSHVSFFHAAQSASVTLQERATHGLQAEPCVCVCVCMTLNGLTGWGASSASDFVFRAERLTFRQQKDLENVISLVPCGVHS